MPEFVVGGFKHFEENERHITRVCKESVLILMRGGVLRFEEDGELVELAAGDYYIQRAGRQQTGNAVSESPVYFFLHFHGAFSENERDGIPIRGRYSENALRSYVEEFDRRHRARESSYFAVNGLLYQILAELENAGTPENTRAMIARDIKRLIASEYAAPLSLARIAERYGYSEDYTIKLFKKAYGITPYQYLIKKRLEAAEYLLLSTSTSVEEISRRVGYNDFSTFYRDFRKRFGIAPSQKRASGRRD